MRSMVEGAVQAQRVYAPFSPKWSLAARRLAELWRGGRPRHSETTGISRTSSPVFPSKIRTLVIAPSR